MCYYINEYIGVVIIFFKKMNTMATICVLLHNEYIGVVISLESLPMLDSFTIISFH